MMITRDWTLLCVLALGLPSACGAPASSAAEPGGSQCVPNMAVACACADGARGAQTCRPEGVYEPCRCAVPSDASQFVDASQTMDGSQFIDVSRVLDVSPDPTCPEGSRRVVGECLTTEEVGGVGGALAECPATLLSPLAVDATVSCGFRCHGSRAPGIDYVAPLGSGVHSPVDGTVITAVNTVAARPGGAVASTSGCAFQAGLGVCCGSGFGNYVVIKDRRDRLWYLGHMESGSVVVRRGQVVRAGQSVGRLGNSGYTCSASGGNAAHVHLSVKVGGDWTDFTQCTLGRPTVVAPIQCVDEDLDTYGVGTGCDAEDCDDHQPDHQSWNRSHSACLGAEMGGNACADRDGDGSFAGSACAFPDEDCDDFDAAVRTGCHRCAGAACSVTPAPRCGDGACNGSEDCRTCPGDCSTCAPTCGDRSCNGAETCTSCPGDCGACAVRCGDGTCNGVETCTSCAGDCGTCPDRCGDGTCGLSESCTSCRVDCGACAPRCGDGSCNGVETCTSCAGDCGTCPVVTCPCFSGSGSYCGSNAASLASSRGCSIPVLAGNAGNLLRCTTGAWSLQQACSAGCTVAPAGSNDACSVARPVCPCFSGNGSYCGSNAASLAASRGCDIPVSAGNASNLLRCTGGAWSLQQTCTRGCYVAPAGMNDRCN